MTDLMQLHKHYFHIKFFQYDLTAEISHKTKVVCIAIAQTGPKFKVIPSVKGSVPNPRAAKGERSLYCLGHTGTHT